MPQLPLRRFVSLCALFTAVIAASVVGHARPPAPADQPIDLLKLLNLNRDTVQGRWAAHRRALVSDASQLCVIQVPYLPPEEYDLEIDAERLRGSECFRVIVPVGQSQPSITLDAWGGAISGLERIDGNYVREGEASFRGHVFPDAGDITIIVRVRRKGVSVVVDGKSIVDWKGDPTRLSLHPGMELPHKKALGLGTHYTTYRITRMELTPITGEGERLK